MRQAGRPLSARLQVLAQMGMATADIRALVLGASTGH